MARADGKPITVLVVDDETVLAEMVSMALRYEGWTTATAGDGASAIAAAKAERPDVVVLDVMLPDMSGLDVLRKLREINPRLPVLFLTAKDALEDRIAGLTAGGDDYVTKPKRWCCGCGRCCGAPGSAPPRPAPRSWWATWSSMRTPTR